MKFSDKYLTSQHAVIRHVFYNSKCFCVYLIRNTALTQVFKPVGNNTKLL